MRRRTPWLRNHPSRTEAGLRTALPRLRAAPAEEPAALLSLRDKAQDLTQYLDDLRAGRQELEDAGLSVREPLD